MLKVGSFIQNRYEIISRIGSGGMADVYKARDHKLNRFVAIKVLKKEFREDRAFISKFRVEAQSAAGLAHANIVNIYDTGEEAGIYYIVMELVEGITLKAYIEKKGRLSVREATSIALQISAGLETAHNNGIIHRDVKPQNIIISVDGKVKVADFGIARASTSNTINSNVMGSVHYASPEQARGGYSDEKSDIYSLGITMYEMLTGKVPFDGDTAVAVALKHLQEEIRPPRELVPTLPYSTNQIVLKCTQKSPDRRYSSMSELIRDLRESLVNPDGDFVVQTQVDRKSQTIIMSRQEMDRIHAERNNKPAYDDSLDVGAAAVNRSPAQMEESRAYQSGSYYQKSGYQEMSPADREDSGYFESDFYADRSEENASEEDARFQEQDYQLEESHQKKNKSHQEDEDDLGINPRLEKAVTIGGILVTVIIGCIFLALLANAVGLLHFQNNKTKSEGQTESPLETEKKTETEKTTEKKTEKASEKPETEKESQTKAAETEKKKVAVPSLLGLTEEEAGWVLSENGLTGLNAGTVDSAEYEAGQVAMQDPAEGTEVTEGSSISYQLSAASAGISVPDVSGQEKSQAQAYLLSLGFTCVLDETQYSDTVEAGYILSSYPAAGTTLQAGDTVTLYVSLGSEEVTYVTVPDCYYCDEDITTQRCELYGLGTPVYTYEASSEVNQGFVIRQNPEAGSQVPAGTSVSFVVSTGPSSEAAEDSAEEVWQCYAQLDSPAGYTGQTVQIDLVQEGSTRTVFYGNTSFPYILQEEGTPGVSTGTVYVYLISDSGMVESTIEYDNVQFSRVG